jgi:hypothetical protein
MIEKLKQTHTKAQRSQLVSRKDAKLTQRRKVHAKARRTTDLLCVFARNFFAPLRETSLHLRVKFDY